jgi:hypothetical protein
METNYRTIAYLIAFCIVAAGVAYFISPPASADAITIVPTTPIPLYTSTPTIPIPVYTATEIPTTIQTPITESKAYRPPQGGTVEVGDIIDISGLWADGLAWYGTYGEYDSPQYIRLFKDYYKDIYSFYVDPDIFTDRTGTWYKYSADNLSTKAENTVAFRVVPKGTRSALTLQNATQVNNVSAPMNVPSVPILPDIHIADYLLAIGDPLTIDTGTPAKVWIFGTYDKIYDVETTKADKNSSANITFSGKDLENWQAGSYKILIQQPGHNGQYDVRYRNTSIEWTDGWNVHSEDLNGIQPVLAIDKLKAMIEKTDDIFTVYDLQLQHPSISIVQMDEIGLGSREAEFHDTPGLVTLMDVRGYTNVKGGTPVSVVLDKYNKIPHDILVTTEKTTAIQEDKGSLSVYRATVPLIWNDLKSGVMHTMTAETTHNAIVYADIPVIEMPAGTEKPNVTLKYIANESPWRPNLTTVTITIPVPGPTQTIIVPVSPNQSMVNASQLEAARVLKGESDAFLMFVAQIIGAALLLIGGVWYGRSVLKRAKVTREEWE